MSDPRHNGSISSTGDIPYHSTPQRPHFADDFQSPSLFTSSKSKLMKEVIAEIDREISTRKKELSALRSRSATKRRPSHKNQFTPIANQQIKHLLSPTQAEELAKDMMRLANGGNVNETFSEFVDESNRHIVSPNLPESPSVMERRDRVYDVSNIQDELEVEDATVNFGISRYDHIHLSIHSPVLESSSTQYLNGAIAFPEESVPMTSRDLFVDHQSPSVSKHNLMKEDSVRHQPKTEDERNQLVSATRSDDTTFSESKNGDHMYRSYGSSHSRMSLTPPDPDKSFASSVHTVPNQVEVETYKMKYHTTVLKYNILKKEYEEISEKLQKSINESSVNIIELKNDNAKLEQEKLLFEEEVISLKEELLFVRSQLQTKSARVTDLEAELLISHKYAHTVHNEMQTYRNLIDVAQSDSTAEHQKLAEQVEHARLTIGQYEEESRRMKKQIADYLQDRSSLLDQLHDLNNRLKQSDSMCFDLETKNASMEETIAKLMKDKDLLNQAVEKALLSSSSLANPQDMKIASSPIPAVRNKILLISKENIQEHKRNGIVYQHRVSLVNLLLLITALLSTVWVLMVASVYYYLQTLDPSAYYFRITS